MIALSMTTKEQDFILNIGATILIHTEHLMFKSLPLCVRMSRIKDGIIWICSVDQAKVGGGLSESQ